MLQRLVADTEKLGARQLVARAHFLLAELLRQSGNVTEAATEYASTLKALQEMKKDTGESILRRVDIKSIFDQSIRGASPSTSK